VIRIRYFPHENISTRLILAIRYWLLSNLRKSKAVPAWASAGILAGHGSGMVCHTYSDRLLSRLPDATTPWERHFVFQSRALSPLPMRLSQSYGHSLWRLVRDLGVFVADRYTVCVAYLQLLRALRSMFFTPTPSTLATGPGLFLPATACTRCPCQRGAVRRNYDRPPGAMLFCGR
jgi:hypothetical protein